jgi:Glycosyltransferase family 87
VAILVAIALGTLGVIGGLLVADIRLSGQVGGGGNFYSLWAGSREYLFKQGSPYSADVASYAQYQAYGRAAATGENPYRLTVPLFLLPLFFPFGLANTPVMARGIWLGLGQAALIGGVTMSLSLLEWKPRLLLTLVIGFISVFGFYAVTALISGSPAVPLTLVYTAILWALRGEREELAGALMALSLFMWEVGAIFLILIAWHVLHQKRWGVLAGFVMTLVLLVGISFLLDPGWMLPFLTSTVGQLRSLYGASTTSVLVSLSPPNGTWIARFLMLLVLVVLVLEWWSARDGGFKRFIWLAYLALAATPLLGLRTELSNLVVLGPGLVLICAAAIQRGRLGGLLGLTVIVAVFFVPWLLASSLWPLDTSTRYDYLFLFYPLVSILGLYWTRWWFLSPRRTWLDEIRMEGHAFRGKVP